jgi:putative transposase
MYMVTRRCTQRQFLLRPDEKTTAIIQYCFAEAAERHGINLIVWTFMSNHYHAVVYDEHGRLPAFLEHAHKMIARCLNTRWGRRENLWSSEPTCVTYLPIADAVFDKVVYVLANPVLDDLVEHVADWPGATAWHYLDGSSTVHRRPDDFFRSDGAMPEQVTLRSAAPPRSICDEPYEEWVARVRAAVAQIEAARKERSRPVVGRNAIVAASPFSAPSTPEPPRELRPCVACRDKDRRVIELGLLKEFRHAHREARLAFAAGNHHVEFPAGTYRHRTLGARCAPIPIAA